MSKSDIIINIINIAFTISNTILGIVLEVKKNSFISETTTTLVRYRYFLYVLLDPYFKLIMTALFFDILLYLSSFLLKRFFFKLNNEENQENVLTKSIQDNMISNILVEFFFMTMIKGLALGFGFFYIIELYKEIDKIKGVRDVNKEQENILNQMVTIIIICGISNIMTIGYQFIFFGIRLCGACSKNNFFFAKKKLNNLEKRNEDKTKIRKSKDENSSEIQSINKGIIGDIITEKLDQ
jgi:hypothetical protein